MAECCPLSTSPSLSSGHLLLSLLLSEHLSAHCQNSLETLSSFGCVLSKSLNSEVFDFVPYFLPATTHGDDLSCLVEGSLALRARGVFDRLLYREQVVPSHVLRAHCDLLVLRVDVGDFVDHRLIL